MSLASKIKDKILVWNHHFHWRKRRFKAWLQREERVAEYLKTHAVAKLQLGSGPFRLDGWLNTELFGDHDLISVDLTKTFPLPDNSFDFVYLEHTIEHFTLEQGRHIFAEMFRVLKPGGVVRIATPDLKFLVDLYSKKKSAVQKKYITWHCTEFGLEVEKPHETFVINNFVRAWGHKFIYDLAIFKMVLETAGFEKVVKEQPHKSNHKALQNIEHHGESLGEAFNLLETLVVEARKPKKAK